MRAAIYCRVSTDSQESEGTSLQTQQEACLKYCQDKDYDVHYSFSEAYSGLTLERPKLNELRELIRSGAIDVIVIYCLDRLSRDPVHGVIIIEELEKHHVTLEAVTETVDSSEVGKLISYIRGFASKLEAQKIRERTMRGKKAFLEKGKIPTGSGIGIYGYKWDKKNKKRIPLEFEAKIVQRIFTELVGGNGCSTIARTLNEQKIPSKSGGQWCARTIFNIARNPSYAGLTYYGQTRGSRKTKLLRQPKSEWILLPDATPAVISRELFDQVQEIRQQNRELHSGKPTHDYLLRGHARCGYCGTPLVGSFMNKRFRYYHCRATYPTANRTKTCDAKYIRADYLEDLAWQGIRKVLEKPQVVLAGVKEQLAIEQTNCVQGVPLDKEIEQFRKKIRGYDSQEKRLVQLLRYNEVDENFVLDEMNKIKVDRQADKQILESFIKTKERMENLEKVEVKLSDYCQRLKQDLDSASYQDKRDVLHMLAIKVTATTEAVSVDGIIPIEPMSEQSSGDSEATHHWTNMGMTTWM